MARVVAVSLVLAGLAVAAPDSVSAQFNFQNLQLEVIQGGNLFTVLNNVLRTVLLIIGIIAFIYLLYAGFMYLSAGGDPAKSKAAVQTIVNVIIGIIIIAVSYVLLTFVIGQTRGGTTSGGTNTNQGGQTGGRATPRPRSGTAQPNTDRSRSGTSGDSNSTGGDSKSNGTTSDDSGASGGRSPIDTI